MPNHNTKDVVDELGRTPLHYAAANGNIAEVVRLLREGAEANAIDRNGWSPLHFASQANSASVTEVLLNAGASHSLKDSHGNTPLFRAVFCSQGCGEVIALLRAAGADPFAVNAHGVSPVSLANTIGNFNVAQFFEDIVSKNG